MQERKLDAILVLRIQDGNDIFLSISGSYVPSFYGLSLSALAAQPRQDCLLIFGELALIQFHNSNVYFQQCFVCAFLPSVRFLHTFSTPDGHEPLFWLQESMVCRLQAGLQPSVPTVSACICNADNQRVIACELFPKHTFRTHLSMKV